MIHAERDATKRIALLALVQGLLVFVPISGMKFMPESGWPGGLIGVGILLALVEEIRAAILGYRGRRRIVAVGATVGYVVLGLPLIGAIGFLVSLAVGTFVFPSM